ncbi:MAG: amidohydrolase family protein, partial [Gemmatimonadales bacterium]|nr:amidohydrolase family protein [Gemmatimonadales bacterium]MBT6696158.1 amidohydrolase family protein [Gemmatimonadales bacterium]
WLAPDEYAAVLAASHIQGLPVDGHVPTSMTVTAVAAAGQRTVEHGGSVLGGLLLAASSDEEALRAELLAAMDAARTSGQFFAPFALAMGPDFTDRLLRTFDESKASLIVEAFREAGTALVPTLVVGHPAFRSVDPEFDGRRVLEGRQMDYVSGDVLEMWKASATSPLFAGEGIQAARDRYEALADLVGRMHRAGVPVLPGTDLSVEAPWQVAGFSLHDELLLLVEAGLSPMDAIRAATSTPATVLGLIDLGTVEVGKLADLVILDADPLTDIRNTRRIAGVVSRGIYLGRPALDSLLTAAEEVASGARN